jgi:hypothetical protein
MPEKGINRKFLEEYAKSLGMTDSEQIENFIISITFFMVMVKSEVKKDLESALFDPRSFFLL